MRDFLSHGRAFLKLVLFALVTLVLIPFQLIFMIIIWHPKRQSSIVRLWYWLILKICGIRVTVAGKKHLLKGQKIILCNHISYLDILVLGAVLDCFFVAKSDVADWPVFGFLSKIGNTIFISRNRAHIRSQSQKITAALENGKTLLIFPEGTTGNGRMVLPFKSGLLNNLPKSLSLQPVTLAYTHLNRRQMRTPSDFDKVAWYGAMTLAPHLWRVWQQRSFHSQVTIHPPFEAQNQAPKELALRAQEIVSEGFSALTEHRT